MEGGSCAQSASAPNFSVNIKAGDAPEGKDSQNGFLLLTLPLAMQKFRLQVL